MNLAVEDPQCLYRSIVTMHSQHRHLNQSNRVPTHQKALLHAIPQNCVEISVSLIENYYHLLGGEHTEHLKRICGPEFASLST